MNPAALAECHPNCRTDGSGEPILPNGTPWRQQLLMLGLSSKLLVDAEKALDIQKAASSGAGALSCGPPPQDEEDLDRKKYNTIMYSIYSIQVTVTFSEQIAISIFKSLFS